MKTRIVLYVALIATMNHIYLKGYGAPQDGHIPDKSKVVQEKYDKGEMDTPKVKRAKGDSVEVYYDAVTGRLVQSDLAIDQDGKILFHIKNINLFLYDVTISEIHDNAINRTQVNQVTSKFSLTPLNFNVSDVSLIAEQTAIPKQVEGAEIEALRQSVNEGTRKIKQMERNLADLENSYDDWVITVAPVTYLESELVELRLSIAQFDTVNFEKDAQKFETKKAAILKQIEAFKASPDIKSSLDSLASYRLQRQALAIKIDSIQSAIDKAKDKIWTIEKKAGNETTIIEDFNNAVQAYHVSVRHLNQLIGLHEGLRCLLYSNNLDKEAIKNRDQLIESYFGKVITSKGELIDYLNRRFEAVQDTFSDVSRKMSKLSLDKSETQQNIKDIFVELRAFHSSIKYEAYSLFFTQIAAIWDAIHPSNYRIDLVAQNLSENADLVKYSITAIPKGSNTCSSNAKPIQFEFVIRIRRGVKIDVSPGFFVFGGMKDQSFSFATYDSSGTLIPSSSTVVASDGGDIKSNLFPSIGAAFSIYCRSEKVFKSGLNFGFSTNGKNVRYFIGPCLLLGRSERIGLTAGAALGQVKAPTLEYAVGSRIWKPLDQLEDVVPLRDPSPFKLGYFFGLTINLWDERNAERWSQLSSSFGQ